MNPNFLEWILEIERLAHRPGHHQAQDSPVQEPTPIVMDQDHHERPKPLKDYFIPNQYQPSSCIQLPQHQAVQYEIMSSTIQMLPSFYGNTNEDPYKHLDEFLEICSTVKIQNFNDDALKLTLFPFSLKDKAKH